MRILVLNGSPKKEKSDTIHMTRAFLEGMNAFCENEITIIDVVDQDIRYCTGCFACKKNGGACLIDDDMKKILEQIVSADVLIYSFPLYSYGMPAPLKNLLDRTMPLSSWNMSREENGRYAHKTYHDLSHLQYVMICGCGYPNAKHNFEGAVRQFELKYPENHTVITVSESPMFNISQARQFTEPRLAELKEAGVQFAENFFIDDDLMEKIRKPMIPEEIYARFANGEQP